MTFLYWLNLSFIVIGAVTCLSYICLYHLTARWWKTFVGQQHMALMTVITFLYTRSVFSLAQGKGLSPGILSAVLAGTSAVVLVWGLVNYIRLQHLREESES